MPQRQAPSLEIYEGTVTKVNQSGFQLTGHGQAWFNVSKYADPLPELPIVGDLVECGVDGKGFVYSVEVVKAAQGQRGPQQQQRGPQRSPQPQSGPQRQSAPSGPSPAPTATPSASELTREQRARALALETAGQFLASRTDAKARDVLTVASVWARFILTGELPNAPAANGQQRPPQHEPDLEEGPS